MDVEGTYKGGPQKSGSIRFETVVECHGARCPRNSAKVE